jgi:hypothetical protein
MGGKIKKGCRIVDQSMLSLREVAKWIPVTLTLKIRATSLGDAISVATDIVEAGRGTDKYVRVPNHTPITKIGAGEVND